MVGRPPIPIYQRIAVGLYVLGGGQTFTKSRITLNIGYGTVWKFTWRLINLLVKLVGEYIQWPPAAQRVIDNQHRMFRRCVGFLDGSNIVLRDKPMVDPKAYFSRKKNYGFNLQAICDWKGRFIWTSMGHTAGSHDSLVFKSTDIYRNPSRYFDLEEYVLADKAYGLERHIITPYKEPASSRAENTAFNYHLSIPRVKIEHAFGVLKARWPILHNLPIRIGQDKERGHRRVIHWTMACIVSRGLDNEPHNNDLGGTAEYNNGQPVCHHSNSQARYTGC